MSKISWSYCTTSATSERKGLKYKSSWVGYQPSTKIKLSLWTPRCWKLPSEWLPIVMRKIKERWKYAQLGRKNIKEGSRQGGGSSKKTHALNYLECAQQTQQERNPNMPMVIIDGRESGPLWCWECGGSDKCRDFLTIKSNLRSLHHLEEDDT